MSSTAELITIIPARGGSKGIPGKNIRELGGKPLIAWTIEAAHRCPDISRVIVSTDDEAIAEIARVWKAEVPELRPQKLAQDNSSLDLTVAHTLRVLTSKFPINPLGYLLMLPTSPFRSQELIDKAASTLKSGNYASFQTLRKMPIQNGKHITVEHGKTSPIRTPGLNRPNTYYRPYGLLSGAVCLNNLQPGYTQCRYHIIDNELELIDIDTEKDFSIAERVIQNMKYLVAS